MGLQLWPATILVLRLVEFPKLRGQPIIAVGRRIFDEAAPCVAFGMALPYGDALPVGCVARPDCRLAGDAFAAFLYGLREKNLVAVLVARRRDRTFGDDQHFVVGMFLFFFVALMAHKYILCRACL